jgi:tRNA-2-methylthio-N6-dimethylallyladenosine synthase
MTIDLLEAVRDLPKCSHYLHVPLQSGCDNVLQIMKRGYTVANYREMMHQIRDVLPDCAVSSDFIVGHPGETEESYRKSLEAIREWRFKNSFIFKYSPRPGTKAYELYPDEIPDEVKRQRNVEMLNLQNEISEEDNAEFIGQTVQVLVEGPSKASQKRDGAGEMDAHDPKTQLVGRTRCDRIVVFEGNRRLAGTMARVLVHDCSSTTLIGTIETREYQHGASELLPILQ